MKKEEERFAPGNLFEGIVSVRALIENAVLYNEGKSDNNRRILRLFYDRKNAIEKQKEYSWLQHRAEELGFEICLCEREQIDTMTVGNTHGGLAAECGERVFPTLTKEKIPEKGFYVMLEGIEDPYNFGYAIRSLYAAGADGILLGERNWMSAAGVVCRASAGASERLSFFSSSGTDAASILKAKGYRIICADLRDSVSLYDADLSLPLLLVVGGEKRGISRGMLALADLRVRIDYAREFGASLSAASAATVAGYEVFRQNR